MEKHKKIAVDICNTLADVNAVLKDYLGEIPNPSSKNAIDSSFFKQNLWIFESAKPIKCANKKLHEISKEYEVIYITARPEVAKEVTEKWLEINNFPKGKVYFTKDKALLAHGLDIKLAIEDAPHEIANYLRSGVNVIVKAWDYNAKFSNRFEWDSLKVKDLETEFEIKPKDKNETFIRSNKDVFELKDEWELDR